MEDLIAYIQPLAKLSPTEIGLLKAAFKEKHVKKGEVLQPDLHSNPYFGFIVSGILKLYMLDGEGNESSLCFCASKHFICSPNSIATTCSDSNFSMKAITQTDLLLIDVKDFTELTQQIPQLSLIQSKIYADAYMELATRSQKIQTIDATNRYLQFTEQQPEVAKHATAQDIANYLQLSRETISRIRKKLATGDIM